MDRMRDYMTLQAVEEGLPRGAQPQAAALLLAALQVCTAIWHGRWELAAEDWCGDLCRTTCKT